MYLYALYDPKLILVLNHLKYISSYKAKIFLMRMNQNKVSSKTNNKPNQFQFYEKPIFNFPFDSQQF